MFLEKGVACRRQAAKGNGTGSDEVEEEVIWG